MKKFLLGLLSIMAFAVMPNMVRAEAREVTVYLFRGGTCEHCEDALTYLNNHKEEIPEGVNFVTYEVWKNKNNAELQEKVSEKIDIDEKDMNKVPLFVIGEKNVLGYSSAADFKEIFDIAKEYQNSETYKDIVKETIKELNIDVKSMGLDQIFSEPNKVVTIVVYSIFGVIVLGIGAMILFSRKR